MTTLSIPTARVFVPLLQPSRYKGAWGGRGSGKSHFFAERLIEDSLAEPGESGEGMRAVCLREVQNDLAQSSKALVENKLRQHGLTSGHGFRVMRDVIELPRDGLMIFKGMNDFNADSIKSLEGFKRAWWEEAQTASITSLNMLRPTLRAPNSELWFSWNPRRRTDAVDVMLRGTELPTGATVIKSGWRDNPWFGPELEQERRDCLRQQPDQYQHIWEGDYVSVVSGAYYAAALNEARQQGRIGKVAADPLMTIRLFVDIGGTGARADAFAIWAAQFIGQEVRVLDYYEAVGQPLASHVAWMRLRGYTPDKAQVWLPHDGETHDKVHDASVAGALRQAGYAVTVIPNQGKGAARARVDAGRRLFASLWFNEATCDAGLAALGWYHEKKDDARGIGLGPDHDWSSHGCFAGETLVWTRQGMRAIMSLPINGEVMTPCGWMQYQNLRLTKRDAKLVEVRFADGLTVRCTPEHLFLTDCGWKSAESLMSGSVILSTWTRSRSISTGVSIACGRASAIFHAVAGVSTGTCGLARLGKSLLAAISTTRTAMSLTTGSAILSACLLASTPATKTMFELDRSAKRPVTRPLIGTSLTRAGSGTRGKPKGLKAGQNGAERTARASIVAWCSSLLSERAGRLGSTATAAVKRLLTRLAESRQPTQKHIVSVRHLSEVADVWDMTVPGQRCFSLANGAIVHNSDAFGLMCVAYEPPSTSWGKALSYPKMGYA